jgi:hypothetical protein
MELTFILRAVRKVEKAERRMAGMVVKVEKI